MSDDDRNYQMSCVYLTKSERADYLNGPEPPWWVLIAAVLAAASIGLWIGRHL